MRKKNNEKYKIEKIKQEMKKEIEKIEQEFDEIQFNKEYNKYLEIVNLTDDNFYNSPQYRCESSLLNIYMDYQRNFKYKATKEKFFNYVKNLGKSRFSLIDSIFLGYEPTRTREEEIEFKRYQKLRIKEIEDEYLGRIQNINANENSY